MMKYSILIDSYRSYPFLSEFIHKSISLLKYQWDIYVKGLLFPLYISLYHSSSFLSFLFSILLNYHCIIFSHCYERANQIQISPQSPPSHKRPCKNKVYFLVYTHFGKKCNSNKNRRPSICLQLFIKTHDISGKTYFFERQVTLPYHWK